MFSVHGQAASSPVTNRISECVCLRLLKEYRQPRNRPYDNRRKQLSLQHSIVHTFCHIKQLLEDCAHVTENTNLVLVTINNSTVASWISARQKKASTNTLLQGVKLPEVEVSKEAVLSARERPPQPQPHHTAIQFDEPQNREGEAAFKRKKRKKDSPKDTAPTVHSGWQQPFPPFPQQPFPPAPQQPFPPGPQQPFPPAQFQSGWPGTQQWPGWPYYPQYPMTIPAPSLSHPPVPPSTSTQPPSEPPSQSSSRQREWRHRRAEQEDEERRQRGEPPKKRYKKKSDFHYLCKICGKPKTKETGHSQMNGKWYCPELEATFSEWKELNQKKK